MNQYYYVDAQNQTQGPVAREQLQQLKASGVLNPNSYVCVAGEAEWKTLNSISAIHSQPQIKNTTSRKQNVDIAENEFVDELQYQSTFLLFILSIVTLCIYPIFYLKNRTTLINKYADTKMNLTVWMILLIVITILNIIALGTGTGALALIYTVWSFKAANRVKSIQNKFNNDFKCSGVGLLFFHMFAFNHSLNFVIKNK